MTALKAVAARLALAPADGHASLPAERGQFQRGDQRGRLGSVQLCSVA